jgi:DNA-binding NarL/FixJ family response regulator
MSPVHSSLPTNPFTVLSRREREVLGLVAQDRTDRAIAHQLGIRERTVRAHVSRIILKLGVASRVGAAVALVEWAVCGMPCQCTRSAVAEKPMVAPDA